MATIQNTQDAEAGSNLKASSDGKQKTNYEYKAHVAVEGKGFIKTSVFTAGHVNDSKCFAPLLSGTEAAVYAASFVIA